MPGPTYAILLEDEALLVVDKAPGVLTVSHPGSHARCLLDDLRRDGHAVAPVHRLDRETSGVLLLCLDPAVRPRLEQLFREGAVHKTYLALVHGRMQAERGTIDAPILDLGKSARVDRRGRWAVTHTECLAHLPGASLLRVRPETGRHNQIRVHLAHVGHPLVGDRKFGRRDRRGLGPDAPRTLLHAEGLAFAHPVSGRPVDVSCPPPADFQAVLEALGAGRT